MRKYYFIKYSYTKYGEQKEDTTIECLDEWIEYHPYHVKCPITFKAHFERYYMTHDSFTNVKILHMNKL